MCGLSNGPIQMWLVLLILQGRQKKQENRLVPSAISLISKHTCTVMRAKWGQPPCQLGTHWVRTCASPMYRKKSHSTKFTTLWQMANKGEPIKADQTKSKSGTLPIAEKERTSQPGDPNRNGRSQCLPTESISLRGSWWSQSHIGVFAALGQGDRQSWNSPPPGITLSLRIQTLPYIASGLVCLGTSYQRKHHSGTISERANRIGRSLRVGPTSRHRRRRRMDRFENRASQAWRLYSVNRKEAAHKKAGEWQVPTIKRYIKIQSNGQYIEHRVWLAETKSSKK